VAGTRFWEDLPPGAVIDLGRTTVFEHDVLDFGRRYDPQPFHTDPEAAEEFPYGGLIASGWHTASLYMYLLATVGGVAGAGSPGVDRLRWPHPVRPGDILAARMTVAGSRPSRSRPEVGITRWLAEMHNQRSECVLSFMATSLVRRRPSRWAPS
jgi:acyl dehydratase